MVTKEEFEAVIPDVFKEAKLSEQRRPLGVNCDVVWLMPGGRLGGVFKVDGERHSVTATAFRIRELDERTALIEGLMEGLERPSMHRVGRVEITHVQPFYEALFSTLSVLGILDDDGDSPKN